MRNPWVEPLRFERMSGLDEQQLEELEPRDRWRAGGQVVGRIGAVPRVRHPPSRAPDGAPGYRVRLRRLWRPDRPGG
ncbi:MAG TPA: hypothetical protein VI248_15190 [Kineosporiaceae bacterium]